MTSDQGPQGFVLPVRVQRCWSVGTFTTADALRRHFTERPFFVPNPALQLIREMTEFGDRVNFSV